ncbi:MAG TPA: ATP-binding protein [Pirellulaceae bacterium]|jgi:DNA topoisomerase-6 subunit B|nr:ATP-binding protein [Pirellulaceae bacterium]
MEAEDEITDETAGSTPASSTKRRATAQSMAAGQREISVSEFFAKNRHLLGFDNPRKALLTTVKEAVDNSLDACEEAGILPEIWVQMDTLGNNRFRVAVQDNGPGIVPKQIPLIFGKLLYGSKFHRLRMSRGQQGIGISAAGMYGMLTTGQPVRILSKTSIRKPIHFYEIKIDTKTNKPEILNGKGQGEDFEANDKGRASLAARGVDWVAEYDAEVGKAAQPLASGTRVAIELEGRYQRGRGSVDEYLEQTAIANPHVTIHYRDPEGKRISYLRSSEDLPPEPKEIKPHPYGVELGRLQTMLQAYQGGTVTQFLQDSFSCVTPSVARKICETANVSTRMSTGKAHHKEVDSLFQAIQETKIRPPATDCIVPIGEEHLLKGIRHVVPGEFYAAATRPPGVYRGNPFVVEVALAYGGTAPTRISRDQLEEMLNQSDARTLRKFLMTSFAGIGPDGADKILATAKTPTRKSPANLSKQERERLLVALTQINLSEGQSCLTLRYANRVPLQFQHGACAITQAAIATNWRSYGLSQSRGSLPQGPITLMVHIASVWVPFTSESKEAIAAYPEIEKELRLALQTVGRKLAMFLKRRQQVQAEGERRSIFLRYLGEVADAVGYLQKTDRTAIYAKLLDYAKNKTKTADLKIDKRGRAVEELTEDDFGGSVLIVRRGDDELPGTPETSIEDEPAKA